MAIGLPADRSRFQAALARVSDVRKWISEAPPWLVSLAVHVVVFMALAAVSARTPKDTVPVVVETRLDDYVDELEFTQSLDNLLAEPPIEESLSFNKVNASVGELGDPSFGGNSSGTSFGSGASEEGALAAIDMSRRSPTLAGPGGIGMPTGVKIDSHVAVRGGTESSAGAGGVAGAIDRITFEIAQSLNDRKTLVIWVLDATASLKPQRDELAKRIDRVYEELGALDKGGDRALLTAVVAFGEKDVHLTPDPTDDLEQVKKAIRSVKDDESGTENIFGAVGNALNKWGKYRSADRRNILIIILTDERGDDEGKMEDVLAAAQTRYQAKVYVAGAAAPLGRPQVMLPWPSPSQVLGYAPADRGPESARVERDFLPFWSPGGRMDNLSSGFGPWALSRLCRETGGIFFIMEDGSSGTFDPSVLKAYEPDYIPRKEYDRLLAASPIRKAVVTAAEATGRGPQQIPNIPLEFPGDDAGLNRGMGDGQAIMAKLQYFVEEPLRTMLVVERDRDKESSRRWRAEYDLLLGRLLATKVRTYTYNAMCAQMKKKKKEFENPESNAWSLRPDSDVPRDTPAGPKLVDAAEKARQLLNRVIEENPGTPWADFANRELQTDLGFRWQETKRPVPTAVAKNAPKAKPATPKPTPKPNPPPPPPAVPKKI